MPEGRVKPWGTSHAILSARDVIDGPFAVINADDYYGPEAFQKIYDYLLANPDRDGKYEYAMVGYLLENTVRAIWTASPSAPTSKKPQRARASRRMTAPLGRTCPATPSYP